MSILQITYSLRAGGAERFIVDLCNELSKNSENEVTLLSIQDDTITENTHYRCDLSDKVSFLCLKQNKGLTLANIVRVYLVVKKIKPDVVHCHASALLLFITAVLYTKCRYIFTFHSLVSRRVELPQMRWLYNWYFKTERIHPISISKECQKSYEHFFHSKESVCVVNGRSLLPKTEKFEEVSLTIKRLKHSPDEPVIVHVARADEVKNHKLLLSSFARLEDEGLKFQLIIVGDKYNEKGLTVYASHRIHFFGLQKNVGDYLACGDYFVLSSLKEGLPLSLLEAMSFGLIPICTPAGGICDVIRDGDNGFLSSNCTEVKEFCATVRRALSEGKSISHDRIKQEWREKYSMSQCAKNYLQVYT